MVAVGEGAQAARYQRHCAEPGTGLAGRVRAGGILLVVLAVTRGFQPVVGARKGHLHDCWRHRTGLRLAPYRTNFASEGPSLGPSRSWRVLLSLIWEPQQGVMGEGGNNSDFLTKDRSLFLSINQAQSCSVETEILLKREKKKSTRVM